MKKTEWILSTIIYLSLIVHCSLEIPEEIVKEIAVIEIMEEDMNDFTVKPFEEFPAYYQAGSAVFGIPLNAKGQADLVKINPKVEVDGKEIDLPFNQFFAVNGKVYFKMEMNFPIPNTDPPEVETIEKFCTLENGAVKLLETFPEVPEPSRVTGDFNNYKIEIGDYKGTPLNTLTRYLSRNPDERDYTETLMFVDGFILIEGGLLIHAKEGRGTSRPAGLLFWPDPVIVDGVVTQQNRIMNKWKEVGRFWK